MLLIELKKYLFYWKKIFFVFIIYLIFFVLINFIIIKIENNFNNFNLIKVNIVFEKKDTKLSKLVKEISTSNYFNDRFIFQFSDIDTSKNLLKNDKIDFYIYLCTKSINNVDYEFLKSASLISKYVHTYEYYLTKEFLNFIVAYFDAYHPSIISLFNILDKIDDLDFNKFDILKDISNNFYNIYNIKDSFFKTITLSSEKNNLFLEDNMISLSIFFLILFTNNLINILNKSSSKNLYKLYKMAKINPIKLVFIRFLSISLIIIIFLLPIILYYLYFSIILLSFAISSLVIMIQSIFSKKSSIYITIIALFMFCFSDGIISKIYFFKSSLYLKNLSLIYWFMSSKSYANNIMIILCIIYLLISMIFTKKRVENS